MPTEDSGERVSLQGIDPEDALRALLAIDPNSRPVEDAGPHQNNIDVDERGEE